MRERQHDRTPVVRPLIRLRCLVEAHAGMHNKQCQPELANYTGVARWFNSVKAITSL